jgi:phosphatidylglycerophosphatase B
VVWVIPIAFTACSPHSWWCKIAYGFTTSGGPIGFLLLLLFTCLCYTLSAEGIREKSLVFVKALTSLLFFFGVLAWVNEHLTKPVLKLQRPSHVYMLTHTGQLKSIDSLYDKSKNERKLFFEKLLAEHQQNFENIDARVQSHWIEEAGFSFPSGHTFNAFLFSMIIAYAIYFNRSKVSWRKLYITPFIWATLVGISRVAMGAHSALDVSVGALLGIFIGALFLYIDITRHWLTRKTK